jgi:hypothetical protein
VILDLYHTPIKVTIRELMSLSQQRWQEQMTAWLQDWDHVRGQR